MVNWSREEIELTSEYIHNVELLKHNPERMLETDEGVLDGNEENTTITLKIIDWDYWAGLQNITPHQAAKLVHLIDPITWLDDTYALGPLPDDLKEKITRLTQQLESRSQFWSLSSLVEALGKESVPLRMIEAIPTEPKPEAVVAASNDIAYSGLLNTPSRKDDWFQVIDDMTRAFHKEFGAIPNQTQAWGRLWTNPPAGYAITTDASRGEECLKMPGVSPLTRTAFAKRWVKYSADNGQ